MKRRIIGIYASLILVLFGAFSPLTNIILNPQGQTYIAHATDPVKSTQIDAVECGYTDLLCGAVKFTSFLLTVIPNSLATISGVIQDYIIYQNLQSDTFTKQDVPLDQNGNEPFVLKGWKLVRDFANLFFIFALFFIAFMLILNREPESGVMKGFNAKRGLVQVILMAILINFSFLMCRTIIDVSNVMGNVFYNHTGIQVETNIDGTMEGTNNVDLGKPSEFLSKIAGIHSISLGILNKVNPQKLLYDTVSSFTYNSSTYVLILVISALSAIFNFFLAYLFLSSALFLAARIFGLYFLIILSPLAFVSTAIPSMKAKEYFGWDDWFSQLVGLSFSLPIYLFFLYLAVMFLNVGEKLPEVSGIIGTAAVVTVKLISTSFVLILGKKVSKDLSGKFGAMAGSVVGGVVSGVAMVAATAATGGGAAALRMGGKQLMSGAGTALRGIGGATLGKDYTDKLASGMGGDGLKRLNNFNPLKGSLKDVDLSKKGLKNFGKNIAKNAPGNLTDSLLEAARMSGTTFDTNALNFSKLKQTAAVAEIDKKLKEIEEKRKDPYLSRDEKEELRKEGARLTKEKWEIQNPDKVRERMNQAVPERSQQQDKLTQINEQLSHADTKIMNATSPEEKEKLTAEKTALENEKKDIESTFTKVKMSIKQKNDLDKSINDELKGVLEELGKTDKVKDKEKYDLLKKKEASLREEDQRLNSNQATLSRLQQINFQEAAPTTARSLIRSIGQRVGPAAVQDDNLIPRENPVDSLPNMRVSDIPTPPGSVGNESNHEPEYTTLQQQLILNKAIEAERKRAATLLAGISNQSNPVVLSPEDQALVTGIENDMRSLEQEMNRPEIRARADVHRDLQNRLNQLDQQRKTLQQSATSNRGPISVNASNNLGTQPQSGVTVNSTGGVRIPRP